MLVLMQCMYKGKIIFVLHFLNLIKSSKDLQALTYSAGAPADDEEAASRMNCGTGNDRKRRREDEMLNILRRLGLGC